MSNVLRLPLCCVTMDCLYFLMMLFAFTEATSENIFVQVKQEGFSLESHVFRTVQSGTLLSCGLTCLNNDACKSCNYDRDNGTCELNSVNMDDVIGLTGQTGSVYLEVGQDGDLASHGSCFRHRCENNSSCSASCNSTTNYECICQDGYSGDFCQYADSDCLYPTHCGKPYYDRVKHSTQLHYTFTCACDICDPPYTTHSGYFRCDNGVLLSNDTFICFAGCTPDNGVIECGINVCDALLMSEPDD